jgi:hypothetical protein
MVVKPGADVLRCAACGTEDAIPLSKEAITEQSLKDFISPVRDKGLHAPDRVSLTCAGCGAVVDAMPAVATQPCTYCGGHLENRERRDETITPEAVVPFSLDRRAAETALRTWIAKLWFAPSELKRLSNLDTFNDRFLPFFTFDSHTLSHYEGQAGHHYWVTTGSGKNQRRVRRTRWHWRSGVHEAFFDDTLVTAGVVGSGDTKWQTAAAKPYDPARLAGVTALRATREPDKAWPEAKKEMESIIYTACKRRIGGDTQRFVTVTTAHHGVTWKLVLMPRWEGGFRYKNRRFRVTVNGQTGTVHGERPWSWVKLTSAIIVGILIIIGIALMVSRGQSSQTYSDYQEPVIHPQVLPYPTTPIPDPVDIPVER